jgi:hypothetical protein
MAIGCRHVHNIGDPEVFLYPLVCGEKKGPILDNGTSDRASKVITFVCRQTTVAVGSDGRIEKICGVEDTVSKVVECITVELIRTAPTCHDRLASHRDTVLGWDRVREYPVFLNAIQAKRSTSEIRG